ncbi:MAG: tetratricopeptide repeat protein, partial [Actinomycetota bacterium]
MSGTREAVAEYDRAIDRLLRFHPDVLTAADALATDHASVPMGQALIAYLHLMSTDTGDLAGATLAATNLRASAEHPRERMHAAAVDAWLAGDWTTASTTLDDVLRQWPTDLLALAIGHQLDFFLGDAGNLRDRVGRSLREFDPAHPHVGFVRGMQSFGFEEAGHYGQAENAGQAALDANPDDVWAVHAVVHTYEMQGRVDDGLRFMQSREAEWGAGNLFTVHNWWHFALYCLEAGERARALSIYDHHVHTASSGGVPIEMLDASALLWRFLLDGADTGSRFAPLADAWTLKMTDAPWYVFNDMHAVMANVGAGRLGTARKLIDRLRDHVLTATGTNCLMATEIGIPACEAVLAFGEERYDDVIGGLAPIRSRFHHFGGSHAQRDALQRTLLEAALRSA